MNKLPTGQLINLKCPYLPLNLFGIFRSLSYLEKVKNIVIKIDGITTFTRASAPIHEVDLILNSHILCYERFSKICSVPGRKLYFAKKSLSSLNKSIEVNLSTSHFSQVFM